jgi:SagB-type dehydrogenase family enzyme
VNRFAGGDAFDDERRGVRMSDKDRIKLPKPRMKGGVSIEEALRRRRSTRNFPRQPVTLEEISQILWAAQGVTGAFNERTAPSAGGTFPLEMYLVAGLVDGLAAGVYKYRFRAHELSPVAEGDRRADLADAALAQDCVRRCAAAVVLSAVYQRTIDEYGERAVRYVHMEVGHVGQNVHLQAGALGLGTVMVGAFDDDAVSRVLGLPKEEEPVYIMPVGRLP